ncbi:Transposable element Tc1 transposase [Octopus vulgaris]|uniref:Transposable element Tc1 transposase n=1 Tax=Octopus vulgaris TaxID=6645 RepID=A0AA36F4N2_OCTVU|nr:Transposable element Tc1 transposase [Octopus vulgaris]
MKVSGTTLSAILRVLKIYEEPEGLELKKATGRPCKTTMRDDRAMKRYILKNPFGTAAGIFKKIKVNSGTEVSRFIVSRRLKEFGLKTCSSATKPTISKKNKLERLSLAEAYMKWKDENWSKVHFSDESKFNVICEVTVEAAECQKTIF